MADTIVLDEIREQINSGLIQGAVVRTNLSDETNGCVVSPIEGRE